MKGFATYLHPNVCAATGPAADGDRVLAIHDEIRARLAAATADLPALPPAQVSLGELTLVHDAAYIAALRRLAKGRRPRQAPSSDRAALLNGAVPLLPALPGYGWALGGQYEALLGLRGGQLRAAYCFALPGHRAMPDGPRGDCLLNTQAVALRRAQRLGFHRILLIDWDLHRDDGTRRIFAGDPDIWRIGLYTAWEPDGAPNDAATTLHGDARAIELPVLDERISDSDRPGLGLPANCLRGPQSAEALVAALSRLPLQPDLIALYAGFDAHRNDQGRHVTDWVDDDFDWLTRAVCILAEYSGCPILSVHGGGREPEVTARLAEAHIRVLADWARV